MKASKQYETEPPLLAVGPDKASEITDTSRTRIFQAIRDGELAAHKAGKATIIEIDELRRWVRSLPTRGRKLTGTLPDLTETSDLTEAEHREAKLRSAKPNPGGGRP